MRSRGSFAASLVLSMLLAALAASTTSCLARRRVITRKGGQATQALLNADKDTLLRLIAQQYAALNTLNATVDMVPALGTANKGKITEYKDVRAYVLFRKPAFIRIIGLYPVVRNKAFDMVSDGARFRLYIPAKNRFIEGSSQLSQPSENRLENLRPEHFLEALFVRPVDSAQEKTILENFTDEDNAAYLVTTVTETGGQPVLKRQLWFDRLKLQLVRQLIFDAAGDILTDARYNDWQRYDGVLFPKSVEINRPKDEYGVVLTVVKADINKTLTDAQFTLEQPPGTQLHTIGAAATPAPAAVAKKGTPKK